MGWINKSFWSLRTRGRVWDAIRIEERTGFTGERITPSGQSPIDKTKWFTVPRHGSTVYRTKKDAINQSAQDVCDCAMCRVSKPLPIPTDLGA